MMLLDEILPEYQIDAAYSIEVRASIEAVYKAVFNSSFVDTAVFRALMKVRELPARMFGKGDEFIPGDTGSLDDLVGKSKFVLLGKKENQEIVFGLIGRFWDVINTDPRDISDLNEFNAFNKPDYGKAVMNFYLEASGNKTKLYTETRVYFSDDKYLNRFRIYWFVISRFSGLTRKMFLKRIKANAEQ